MEAWNTVGIYLIFFFKLSLTHSKNSLSPEIAAEVKAISGTLDIFTPL